MAVKPKGSQFTTLYRGVTDENADSTPFSKRTGNMGMHWSTDRSVAESFAGFDEEGYAVPGIVTTAKVHNRHIMTGMERRRAEADHGVHSTQSAENEMPVRPGGIIHVQSVENIDEDGNSSPWRSSDIASVFGKRRTGRA